MTGAVGGLTKLGRLGSATLKLTGRCNASPSVERAAATLTVYVCPSASPTPLASPSWTHARAGSVLSTQVRTGTAGSTVAETHDIGADQVKLTGSAQRGCSTLAGTTAWGDATVVKRYWRSTKSVRGMGSAGRG